MMIVIIGAIGLAVDAGRCFIARAELVRAVDAAALSGTLELPNLTNAQAKINTYMAQNQPDATVTTPVSPADRQIQVQATLAVNMTFMRIFGINSVNVHASAIAGYGVLAVDTVMAIDATGSMGVDSNGNPCSGSGCPIYEAKNAANSFTNTLLSDTTASSDTLVGETPFRGCFNLPNLFSFCVPINTMVQPLSNNKSTVEATINSITSVGGSGTNICNGINEADQILYGAGHHTVSNTMRIVVILSDGDNTYNVVANGVPTPKPGKTPTPIAAYALPTACRPPTPNASSDDTGTSCMPAQTHQKALDKDTMTLVNQLKAQGVEFYVVGFGVCGSSSTSLCNTSIIGTDINDTTANRNLLKCIASSTTGTNDHYFEATTATQLPSIFSSIARLIGFRLIN
jgi:Flp pilus assembly protein TadG